MALTLTEAEKLSNDVLLKGIIQTTVKDSAVLQRMPFIEIVGNALTYNSENAMASAGFYDVGDTWAESTPTFTQKTATLKILGGDADVDNFVKATRSNVQDIEAAIIELKAKALRHKFEDTFLYGDTAVDAKGFDGLRKLIATGAASDQVIAAGATGATLTLAMLDQLIDAVKGQKPDLLLMSRRSRRKIVALMRAVSGWQQAFDQAGNLVELYNGIPIGITDWQLDTHTVASSVETLTTGSTCSVIFALAFGEGAIAGVSAPGLIKAESLGSLETKDATRTRIKWYCGLADFSVVKRAALIGVKD